MVSKVAREAGFVVRKEDHGGLTDGRRPGDVMLRSWDGGKHLLVDVAVINPLGADHREDLIAGGVGAAATEDEEKKRKFYHEYQKGGRLAAEYDFLPAIFETSGGVGSAAIRFAN